MTPHRTLSILFLESFMGGSHASFATGLRHASRHKISLLTLPARHWKWRMHGAASWFCEAISRELKSGKRWDLIVATSLINLRDLRSGLAGLPGLNSVPPILLYVHETQFDYPLSPGEERDFAYGYSNLLSIAASDLTLFNSATHRRRFFAEADRFLSRLPDAVPKQLLSTARMKSKVLYPGVWCEGDGRDGLGGEPLPRPRGPGSQDRAVPLILWNHRWEHDKNPEPFFEALYTLDRPDLSWRVAVVGERYGKAPEVFDQARERLAPRIDQFDYLESREEYADLLHRATVVVSTALQENFGISVVEAIVAGALPLLPNRLSYPELIPHQQRELFLYESDQELPGKLEGLLQSGAALAVPRETLRRRLRRLCWSRHAWRFDTLMERLVTEAR